MLNEIRFGELFAFMLGLACVCTIAGCHVTAQQISDLEKYENAIGGSCGGCIDNCSTTPISPQGASGCQDQGSTVVINGNNYPVLCLCTCQSSYAGFGPLVCAVDYSSSTVLAKLERLEPGLDVLTE